MSGRDSDELVLRPEQAAKLLQVSRSKLYGLMGAGELPVLRMGRSVRIPRRALEAWIESRCKDEVA